MTRALAFVVIMSSWAIAEAPAAAQPAVAGQAGEQPAPGFTVIDRIDGRSVLGIEASYLAPHMPEGSTQSAPTVLRFAAHFRYIDPASGVGGYAQIPFVYAGPGDGAFSPTITDVGSLEIGAVYAPKLSAPGVDIVLHAGLALPTGEPGTESLVGTAASVAALPELYDALPRALTGKLGVSVLLHQAPLFARFDLGLDANFSNDADGSGTRHLTVPQGYHFHAGVGLDFGAAAVMLESENFTFGAENNQDGETLSELALGVRIAGRAASPYVTAVLPIEDNTSNTIDVAITAGVDFKL